jgi:alpha-ribazole phosphatase
MNVKPRIAALILAAGYSSRMGAFKPLLPLGGSTAIEVAASRFRAAGVDDITVVTGHNAEQLAPILATLAVRQVFNANYASGMLSSILAGRTGLGSGFDAFFLLPVDIPLIKIGTIETLIQKYATSRAAVIYPRFLGHRGHPPLISAAVPIQSLDPEASGGLGAFLSSYEDEAADVDVADQGIVMDFDTREDYRKLQAFACREDIPTEAECRAISIQYGTAEDVKVHCGMVAELARILAINLNRTGMDLNIDLVVSAGHLHDLARKQPDHAMAGAGILMRMGYPRVAQIVADHMDLRGPGPAAPGGGGAHGRIATDRADPERPVGQLTESHVVYLADKYILDNRLVTLDERFRDALERYADKPEILEKVIRRKRDAESVASLVEKILGSPMDRTIGKHRRGILAVSVAGQRRLYLLRHGAIQAQGDGRYFIGRSDIPLCAGGMEHAQKLREDLRDVPLSAIFCSDLSRSVQTARIIAEPHQLELRVRKELREIDLGEWEGLPFDVVRVRYPGQFEERGRDIVHFRPPSGESFLDCTTRVLPVFYEIAQSVPGNVVIVGHAGINRIILCQVLGMSLERMFELNQAYGCTNIIQCDETGMKLKVLNDVDFCMEGMS